MPADEAEMQPNLSSAQNAVTLLLISARADSERVHAARAFNFQAKGSYPFSCRGKPSFSDSHGL